MCCVCIYVLRVVFIGDPLTLLAIMYVGTKSIFNSSNSFRHSMLMKSPANGDFTIADNKARQVQLKGSVKEPNKFHIYEAEKITCKASDAAEYIELFGSFTRDRHAQRILCYSLNVRRYMRRRA